MNPTAQPATPSPRPPLKSAPNTTASDAFAWATTHERAKQHACHRKAASISNAFAWVIAWSLKVSNESVPASRASWCVATAGGAQSKVTIFVLGAVDKSSISQTVGSRLRCKGPSKGHSSVLSRGNFVANFTTSVNFIFANNPHRLSAHQKS